MIDKVIAGAPDDVIASATAEPASVPRWRRALPWALSGVTGASLLAALLVWAPWRATPAPALLRLTVDIGADASLTSDLGAAAILSPDGQMLAFVARKAGVSKIYVRRLDELQAAPLDGTEGATSPFFSPDGGQLGFFSNLKLKKVPVAGGAATELCDAPFGRGGTWADDDTIIFTQNSGRGARLMRVASTPGGTARPFSTLSPGATTQRWPQVIAGNVVLYTEHSALTDFDSANLVVAPLAGGGPKTVRRGGYYGRYLPTGLASPMRGERAGGHLIYVEQGTLYAVPFDLGRLECVGRAVPVLHGLATNPATAGAQVSFSPTGTLVYLPGASKSLSQPIDWMTRDGKIAPLRTAPANWANPRFSPDGEKLALAISDGKRSHIFIIDDLAHDTLRQLTFDQGEDVFPAWTPDNRGIAFASDRARPGTGTSNIYYVNADGTGEVTRLTDSPERQVPASWYGKTLAFSQQTAGAWELMMLPVDRDANGRPTPGTPTMLPGTAAGSVFPMFSPDGRFIAYFKADQNTYDVYVRLFKGPGGWRISTVGGTYPRWSPKTNEILFLSMGKVMAARYTVVGDALQAETPQPWSPVGYMSPGATPSSAPFDVHPDGRRVAVLAARAEADVVNNKVVFLFNFFDELRRVAPATKK